jgi:hypothetical protein
VSWLSRIRFRIARWIAPASMLFNADMSRELDRVTKENEELRRDRA